MTSTWNLFTLWIKNTFNSDVFFSTEMRRSLLYRFLYILIVTVIFMMVVGAVTRLTDSGLSIPEWPLINGTLMYPITDADWDAVFTTYKQYPQYHLIFKGMTVDEFKFIFFFEYFHRSITTLVSIWLLFIGLLIVFNKEKRSRYFTRFLVIFGLLILQAFVGYYMVKSGLKENMAAVSQYMLMFHLSTAMLFLACILWLMWKVRYEEFITKAEHTSLTKFASFVFVMAFIQFMSGALVAGTKAGYHFTDWPLMNGEWIPTGVWASHKSVVGNLFENIATIQFTHRTIAYTLCAVVLVFIKKVKNGMDLTQAQLKSVNLLYLTLGIQVLLGITTLMLSVPVALGALHQFFGIMLLINLLYVNFQLRYGKTFGL